MLEGIFLFVLCVLFELIRSIIKFLKIKKHNKNVKGLIVKFDCEIPRYKNHKAKVPSYIDYHYVMEFDNDGEKCFADIAETVKSKKTRQIQIGDTVEAFVNLETKYAYNAKSLKGHIWDCFKILCISLIIYVIAFIIVALLFY